MSELSELACAREPESPNKFRRRKAQDVVWSIEERERTRQRLHLVDSIVEKTPSVKRALLDEIARHTLRILGLENEIAQSFAAETPVTEEPKPETSPP